MDLEEDQQKPSINIQNLCAEIEVYQKLEHENIVRYLGAKQEQDTAYIYMEYMPGGSIYSMLKQYGPFEEQVIQKFTRQVAFGLDYLHSMGVIHRDIKVVINIIHHNRCY
jgi:serine/threonine protein kinase